MLAMGGGVMKISLIGLLENAARNCDTLGDGLTSFALRELARNMTEMAERKEEGVKVLDEFFALYVVTSMAKP